MISITYSDEQRYQMDQLAGLCGSVRRWYRDLSSSSHWKPAAESIAARDQKAVLKRSGFEDRAELLISWLCHDFSYAAYVQLGALEAVYRAYEVLLSTSVLVRSVVEQSARIVWILGRLTEEDLDQRLARAFLEEIAGAEQAKLTGKRLVGRDEPYYTDLSNRWRALKQEAERVFPTWGYRDGVPEILGYRAPSPEKAVVEMYGQLTPPRTRDEGAGIYAYLSNNAHPTPYVIRELFRLDVREDGEVEADFGGDPDFQPKLARLALVPFHLALARIIEYHGWPGDRLTDLAIAVEAVLPGTFHGASPN